MTHTHEHTHTHFETFDVLVRKCNHPPLHTNTPHTKEENIYIYTIYLYIYTQKDKNKKICIKNILQKRKQKF